MNVIILLSDQHNAKFMGCSGNITRTPAMDALAASGTRFSAAYPVSPFCAPSRAGMMTGRYAHETGYWDNATPYDGRLPSWPRYFRDIGVHYTVLGKVDYEDLPEMDYGMSEDSQIRYRNTFDVLGLYPEGKTTPRYRNLKSHWTLYPRDPGEPSNKDAGRTEQAIEWLRDKRPKNQPWVLNVHYSKPHPVWAPSRAAYEYYLPKVQLGARHVKRYDDLHPAEQPHSEHTCGYLRGDDKIAPMHDAYHGAVEELNADISRIVEEVDALGIRDDTLIIYTSDHGEMLRAHGALGKMSLYDDSACVPMIVQGPGMAEGNVCDHPVSQLDLYPTAADALGVPPAPFARGHSLLTEARGQGNAERPDFAFSESHANGRITGSFMIRTEDCKLIENVGYAPMLFNLKDDPEEMNDLAPRASEDARIAGILDGMRRRLSSVCSPEAVTARARREQRARLEKITADGHLEKELKRRFCLVDPDHLRLDPVAVEKEYGIKI